MGEKEVPHSQQCGKAALLLMPSTQPLAEGSRVRLGLGEGMEVGTSKGTECSVLRARCFSWPELCHVDKARLFKDMA